jgi:HD-like signal output (HDOD) protein
MLRDVQIETDQNMNENWQSVLNESHLISLPEVYIKLQQLLSNDDYALAEVAEIIGYDPALSARLLHIVNSVFFGLSANIDTISRAVNYLGAQQVHDLVLSSSIADTFRDINSPSFNQQEFWQQSIYGAIAARELAVLCNVLDSERLFVSGLLHKIGQLVMSQAIPQLTVQAQQQAERLHIPLSLAEQEVIGFDYTRAGSELLQHLKLPQSLILAVQHQLHPARTDSFKLEVSIVHIAAQMADNFVRQQPAVAAFPELDLYATEMCRTDEDHLVIIDRLVMESLPAVINLLFPQMKVSSF